MGSGLLVAGHLSEFAHDPVTNQNYNGTCTQTALEICMAAVDGRPATQAHMMQMTRDMISNKTCAADGAATVWAVAQYARDHGYSIPNGLEMDYGHMGDWHKVLLDNAGLRPILLQVANGQALRDVETGAHDESNLHYHAIAVLDKQGDGYVCSDGDNPDVAKRFQIYNYFTLQAAQPCALIVLDIKRASLGSIKSDLAQTQAALAQMQAAYQAAMRALVAASSELAKGA